MIAVIKYGTPQDKIQHLTKWIENQGLGTHVSNGDMQTIIGLIGDTSKIDMELLGSLDIV